MKTLVSFICLWFFSMHHAVAAETWSVRIGEDGIQPHAACLLESATQKIHDSQTVTPIKLVYNGEVIIAVTKSNIDLSYAGVGLQVDGQALHAVDSLHKKTRVIFQKDAKDMLEEFIIGRQARLVLGFWPSWPKTKTVATNFSLLGFRRAYQAFQDCQQGGKQKN